MMTAYREETEDIVNKAVKSGAFACLYKPFNIDDVLKLLEDIIEKKNKKLKKEV